MRVHLIALIIIISVFPFVAAATQVPFANIHFKPKAKLTASYRFGHNPIIFCFGNDFRDQASITWPYQGKIFSANLPIFLKTNANYQGEFADGQGSITVTNTGSTIAIISCQFGF